MHRAHLWKQWLCSNPEQHGLWCSCLWRPEEGMAEGMGRKLRASFLFSAAFANQQRKNCWRSTAAGSQIPVNRLMLLMVLVVEFINNSVITAWDRFLQTRQSCLCIFNDCWHNSSWNCRSWCSFTEWISLLGLPQQYVCYFNLFWSKMDLYLFKMSQQIAVLIKQDWMMHRN